MTLFELFATANYSYDSLYWELKRRFAKLSKSHPTGTSRRNIEKILTNHFYYGTFELKGDLHPGCHEPIISKRLFDEVQRILRGRAGKYQNKHRGKLEFIGFARCLKCEAAFTGEVKRTRHGNIYHYYRCSNPKCPAQKKVISEAKFMELWSEPLQNLSYPPDLVRTFRDILLEHHQSELAYYQQNLRDLNKQHEDITKKIHAAYDDKLRGQIPADIFNDLYQRWQSERAAIED